MAIDTQEKRMSAAGAGRPWMRSKLPGANDEAWRMASGHAYSGNALTGAVQATGFIRTLTFAADTGGGSQSVDLAGMTDTPKAAIFLVSKATADDTAADGAILCVGATDGTNDGLHTGEAEHNQGTTDSGCRSRLATYCIELYANGVDVGTATLTSFDADTGTGAGLTINWSTTPSEAYQITAIFFTGDSLNAAVGTKVTNGTQNNTVDVNTLSFVPDVVIFIGYSFTQNYTNDCFYSLGAAVNDGGSAPFPQACYLTHDRSGAALGTLDNNARLPDDRAAGYISDSGSQVRGVEVTDWIDNGASSGFEITTRDGTGSNNVLFLALGGVTGSVTVEDTPTAVEGSGDYDYTTTGVTPTAALIIPTLLEAVDTSANDEKAGACGVAILDGANDRCVSMSSEYVSGVNTDTQSLSASKALHVPLDDGTTGYEATGAFGAEKVTLSFTEETTNAKKFILLALMTAAAGGNAMPMAIHHYKMAGGL